MNPSTPDRTVLSLHPAFVGWATLASLLPFQLFFTLWASIFFGSLIEQIASGAFWLAFAMPGALAFCLGSVVGYLGKQANYSRTEYRFYPDRLEFDEGFFVTSRKVIPYSDVKEISLCRGFVQRQCGLGTIYLGTPTTGTVPSSSPFFKFGMFNASDSGVALRDIPDPDSAFEKIRTLIGLGATKRSDVTVGAPAAS